MNEDNDTRHRSLGEPVPQEGLGTPQSPKQLTLIEQLIKLAAKKREDADKIDSLIMYISQFPEFEENLKILQSLR